MAFLALRGLFWIQPEAPSEEFQESQFGVACVINWLGLFCEQISLDLAVFGGDEGNFREKKCYVSVDSNF